MADWQIEQVAIGIAVIAIFIHLAAWVKLCDRVTRLEALVKCLISETSALRRKIATKDGDADDENS